MDNSFPAIVGVNTGLGIQSSGGRVAFYKKMLKVYISDAEKQTSILTGVTTADNLRDVRTAVHGLKSASKLIGAAELSDEALALENASASGDLDAVLAGLPGFYERLTAILNGIKHALDEADADGASTQSKAALLKLDVALLRSLAAALKESPVTKADDLVAELSSKSHTTEMKSAIDPLIGCRDFETQLGESLQAILYCLDYQP
jgi:HPt (histidine-containing phosphotransfer) domain-containing protein